MGNRGGVLHDDQRRLGVSRWKTQAWITCVLEFKDRRRKLMSPGSYTELFFLDEPTALAAGHRPCAECRREDFNRFRDAFARGNHTRDKPLLAGDMDSRLHGSRVTSTRRQIRFLAPLASLPDGVMILGPGENPWLVWGERLFEWSPNGYGKGGVRPGSGEASVLTPSPTVRTLAEGYRPLLHPSMPR